MMEIGGTSIVVANYIFTSLTSSLSLRIKGCSLNKQILTHQTQYSPNETVYLKYKALKGLLRKITIKRIIVNDNKNYIDPLYIDTLNSIYTEDELLTKEEALDFAIAFYERQAAGAQIAINRIGCQ